jgi:hypothetical protein
VVKCIKAIPDDVQRHISFDELHTLVTEPIRSQLSKIFALIGVGVACVGVALCCLNQTARDLLARISHRMSVGLDGAGLILIALVIVFAHRYTHRLPSDLTVLLRSG